MLDVERHQGDGRQTVKLIGNEAAPGNSDADSPLFFGSPTEMLACGGLREWGVLQGAIFAPPSRRPGCKATQCSWRPIRIKPIGACLSRKAAAAMTASAISGRTNSRLLPLNVK